MTIKTNEEMRDLYVKHLDKLDDYAKGNFQDTMCYLCEAANAHPKALSMQEKEYYGDCSKCPLPGTGKTCAINMRQLNLVYFDGSPACEYYLATPKSIIKHQRWIQKQIEENTDCVFYWE